MVWVHDVCDSKTFIGNFLSSLLSIWMFEIDTSKCYERFPPAYSSSSCSIQFLPVYSFEIFLVLAEDLSQTESNRRM